MSGCERKRGLGRYYTQDNPFALPAFRNWGVAADIEKRDLLEPFAGSNNLIHMLRDMGLNNKSHSYDIAPASDDVEKRDTIQDFPEIKDSLIVTNPPWLARNSATRRGLPYPKGSKYDDLYKHCLALCLRNADYVAAIIPASFLTTNLFTERLHSVTLFSSYFFDDTEHPSCMALFSPRKDSPDAIIYDMENQIGALKDLKKHLPRPLHRYKEIRFNDPNGVLGLHAIDNTYSRTIRFCEGSSLSNYDIGFKSRSITRIAVPNVEVKKLIQKLNHSLNDFREKTEDVFLTPFKGLRADGGYRRRLDYRLARDFIEVHL